VPRVQGRWALSLRCGRLRREVVLGFESGYEVRVEAYRPSKSLEEVFRTHSRRLDRATQSWGAMLTQVHDRLRPHRPSSIRHLHSKGPGQTSLSSLKNQMMAMTEAGPRTTAAKVPNSSGFRVSILLSALNS